MDKIRKGLVMFTILISVIAFLTGCAALVIGGVGAAGGYYYRKGMDKKGKSG